MRKTSRKMLFAVVLTFAMALFAGAGLALAEEQPEPFGVFEEFSLGNTSLNILNGGVLIDDNGTTPGAEDVEASAGNLNSIDGEIFYTLETGGVTYIKKMGSAGAETVFTWDGGPIKQMYSVNGSTVCFLSEGAVYALDFSDGALREAEIDLEVFSFAPTEYGIVYASGELFDYTLYVDGRVAAEHVESYYTDSGYLVVSIGGEDRQIALDELFAGATAADFEALDLYGTVSTRSLLLDDGVCEECLANLEEYEDGEITLEEYSAAIVQTHSIAYTRALSTGQSSIVKRARQHAEIQWTPLKNVVQWGGNGYFYAGTTYTGLPYGQPVSTSSTTPSGNTFIGYDVTLSQFLQAVNNAGSLFYTKTSTYNKVAPYYSNDCTTFLCHAWGISTRLATQSLANRSTKMSDSVYSMQVGDALLYIGSHATLVSAVEYDSGGNIIAIETLEQTPPSVKRTRYGAGGTLSLSYLQSNYLGGNYDLYRYNSRDSVTYTHDCSIYLDGDSCAACEALQNREIPFADVSDSAWYYDAVVFVYKNELFTGTSQTTFSPASNMTRGMFATALGRLDGADVSNGTITGSSVNFRSGPGTTYSVLGSFVKSTRVMVIGKTVSGGATWYRVTYNGTTGYVHGDYISVDSNTFSDVGLAYYTAYVQWAANNGIVSGYGNGKFGPEDKITREQMCLMLYQYITYKGITLSQTEPAGFTDSDAISDWAAEAVEALQRAGIVSGVETGAFLPRNNCTRAQVAQLMMNFIEAYL